MTTPNAAPAPDAAGAQADALAAARRAGVQIRHPDAVSELHAVAAMFAGIWAVRPGDAPVPADILRALVHVDGYVAVAYRDGRPVGAGVGFFGRPDLRLLHSHIVGVVPGWQALGVGYAVKLDQRAWSLERGLRRVTWTFDPLVRRNAYFNLTKLGARATAYLVDFYGEMGDGVNAGQGSDRLLVEWDVVRPLVPPVDPGLPVVPGPPADSGPPVDPGSPVVPGPPADPGPPEGAAVLLDEGPDGVPLAAGPPTEPTLACRVPADITAVRRRDPALARAWRRAVRDTLGAALVDGYTVTGVSRSGWYVLSRDVHAR